MSFQSLQKIPVQLHIIVQQKNIFAGANLQAPVDSAGKTVVSGQQQATHVVRFRAHPNRTRFGIVLDHNYFVMVSD